MFRLAVFSLSFTFCFFSVIAANHNIAFLSKKNYPVNTSSIWGYTDTVKGRQYALVGTTDGTSIVDITQPANPVQVAFVDGSNGSWRELKTYSHYAYVSQDNNGTSTSEGILIIDLQYLPDSVKSYSFTGTSSPVTRIFKTHSLFVDEKGFLYLNGGICTVEGSSVNGTVMYDLKPNPVQPTYVGKQNARYVHDCYVRNDTLYEAEINNGTLSIYNIVNRSSPQKITQFSTPFNFTHNAWLSDNGAYLFTTDERPSSPIGVYDIRNLSNIKALPTVKMSPTETSIPHNVHVWNDYLVVPHYTNGVAIFDASVPDNVVMVGNYDTNNFTGSTFNGVWGAYPYFSDSTLILSDIEGGLFVLKPSYRRAARLQGIVVDSISGLPLTAVNIRFTDTTITAKTAIDGLFQTGIPRSGTFNVSVEKAGYISETLSLSLASGQCDTIRVALRPVSTALYPDQRNTDLQFFIRDGHLQFDHAASVQTLTIFSASGAKILETGQPQAPLQLPALAPGIYIIHAVLQNGTVQTTKVAVC